MLVSNLKQKNTPVRKLAVPFKGEAQKGLRHRAQAFGDQFLTLIAIEGLFFPSLCRIHLEFRYLQCELPQLSSSSLLPLRWVKREL